jgi:hypothetical protein
MQPTVKRIRPASATSAGPYPKIGGSSLDHIAKSDLFIGDKSGQSYSVSWVFTVIWISTACDFLCHANRLLAFAVNRIW